MTLLANHKDSVMSLTPKQHARSERSKKQELGFTQHTGAQQEQIYVMVVVPGNAVSCMQGCTVYLHVAIRCNKVNQLCIDGFKIQTMRSRTGGSLCSHLLMSETLLFTRQEFAVVGTSDCRPCLLLPRLRVCPYTQPCVGIQVERPLNMYMHLHTQQEFG